MKKLSVLIFISILIVGFFLRFYQLGSVPNGMYQDETAIGYNAYSILKTGKDEYGKFLPLYFKSFGDYKLPLYIYSVVPSVAIFGLTDFAVRFPSALFGFLTIIIFYPFMKLLTKNTSLSLLATGLLAITPWHLHYNRATFEVSISLFFYVLGAWLLLRGIRERKAIFFVCGTLFFLLNIYTYNLTRILSPMLYFTILLLERKQVRKQTKVSLSFTFVFSLLLLLPFLFTLFSAGGASSAGGTLIWSSATIQSQLLELRSYVVLLPSFVQKLFFNIPLLTLWQFFINLASYFSVSFFFLTGSAHGNHGIGNVGQFYLFELPFLLLGLFVALRRRSEAALFFLVTGGVVVLVSSLTRESPHATRSFLLLPTFLYFIAQGISASYIFLRHLKRTWLRRITYATIGAVVIFNCSYYFFSYYSRFPILYAPMWKSEDKALTAFLKENESKYERIIIDTHSGFLYTSILYYLVFPPELFQGTVVRLPDDSEGFSQVKSFGKFVFKEIDWENDTKQQKTLFVTTKKNDPGDLPVLATFTYPQRPVVLAVGQKIMQFPVEDPAYVVLETK